ncbi:MAG: dTMP kinase [Solirubrobacterales bacterium]|nr:dTMP kinase [Solirubrobacterales bacterium]
MARGRLITVEGLDGAGKTTLSVALVDALSEHNLDVRLLREPGGVEAAERIRTLLHDPGLRLGARSEALLFAAARAQLVEEALEPLLRDGTWVVLDRFVDSSLAYQGAGRQLGSQEIAQINRFATCGLTPDRTLLITVPPELGRARIRSRSASTDRLEQEHDDFFSRVASAYEELAARHPQRIRSLDGDEPPDRVLKAALAQLADLLPLGAEPRPQ